MNGNPFLNPARIRAALNSLEMRPSKELGQNFLIDGDALQTVVDSAELGPRDRVLEVGPGLGVLTHELVQRAGEVVAVEFDRRLAGRLEETLPVPNLRVLQGDVLRLVPGESMGSRPYKVVANLPYHITSAILRHFLEAADPPERMVVMVQWEVAQRIIAAPPDMSVLAHSVQFYATATVVQRVKAEAFFPAPKVDSAVLKLIRRPHPAVDVDDVNEFFRVIKAGFLQARKKLRNALPAGLASFGRMIDKEVVIAVLEAADINPDRRAETLTLVEWAAVYHGMQGHISTPH
ncbi:MAG: 16S rRNA (adenine(1518)-N(6)/adenine(1519)-N(6)) -dimethyltransferase RsmA [Herpetosiphon sp.]